MDVRYINPFIQSTREVFKKMVHAPALAGKPYLRGSDDRSSKLFKLTSVISLSGGATGKVFLNFAEAVALAVAEGVTGAHFPKLTESCVDAIREITLTIAGGAKKVLPGTQVNLSVPQVVNTYEVVYPTNMPVITIPFDTSGGRFSLEIMLIVHPQVEPNSEPSEPTPGAEPQQTNQPEPPTQAPAENPSTASVASPMKNAA
jgi:CheY-specific phosphatase CheX